MEKLIVGKILKPQGIKGEVKIKPIIDDFNKLSTFSYFYIGNSNEESEVENCDIRFGYAYVKFKNLNSRNDVENLRNKYIQINKENFKVDNDNEYLLDDLINCKILAENGREIGYVFDVEQYGSADILDIRMDGRNAMVPFLHDIFLDVNISEKTIIANENKLYEAKV